MLVHVKLVHLLYMQIHPFVSTLHMITVSALRPILVLQQLFSFGLHVYYSVASLVQIPFVITRETLKRGVGKRLSDANLEVLEGRDLFMMKSTRIRLLLLQNASPRRKNRNVI